MHEHPLQVVRLRKIIDDSLDVPHWPSDIRLFTLSASSSQDAHDLLVNGYRNGGGTVGPYDEWWSNLQADSEYDAHLCVLAYDDTGIVGIVQCWTSRFVKDLVVHPRRRHEGIATSLLLHVFGIFSKRGAGAVDLKVEKDNTAAMALYLKLGMQPVG